jgi:signal transduction histidine kinase
MDDRIAKLGEEHFDLKRSEKAKRFKAYVGSVLALIVVVAFFASYFVLDSIYETFRKATTKIHEQSIELVSRDFAQKLFSIEKDLVAASQSPSFAQPIAKSSEDARFASVRASKLPDDYKTLNEKVITEPYYGTTVPFDSSEIYKVWQLTRGLPISTLDGRPIAQRRRRILAGVLNAHRELQSITEFDANGQVLITEPYSLQLLNSRFTSKALLGFKDSSDIFDRLLILDEEIAHIALITKIRYSTVDAQSGFIVARLRPNTIESSVAGSIEYCLGNSSASKLACFLQNRKSAFTPVSGFIKPTYNKQYFPSGAVMVTYQAETALLESKLNFSFMLFGLISIHIFILGFTVWITSVLVNNWAQSDHGKSQLRLKLNRQNNVFAHDLRRPINTLRATAASLAGNIKKELAAQLNGVIIDLSSFADQFASGLAEDRSMQLKGVGSSLFSAPEVDDSQGENGSPLYLKGIIQMLSEGYSAGLSSGTIRVVEPSDFENIFVQFRSADIKRVLSNMLDNSIQAIGNKRNGLIEIVIEASALDKVRITIRDNGPGLSLKAQASIFSEKYSEKSGGSGIGLLGCRHLCELNRSQLDFVRIEPGNGAQFNLDMIRVSRPPWFVSAIKVRSSDVIVVVDDEQEVYKYWQKVINAKFDDIKNSKEFLPRLIYLQTPEDFVRNVDDARSKGTVFFIDHDFKGLSNKSGLQLISQYDLRDKAYLVTNYFDNDGLIRQVEALRIKVIPKVLQFYLSIAIEIESRTA